MNDIQKTFETLLFGVPCETSDFLVKSLISHLSYVLSELISLIETVVNPILYKRAYETVSKTYGTQTSAYRSMAIVKEYKRNAGQRFKTLDCCYVEKGKVIPCGAQQRRKHAYRPLVRVVPQRGAPTIKELLKKHGPDKMIQLARTKKQYGSEKVRLNWNYLKRIKL